MYLQPKDSAEAGTRRPRKGAHIVEFAIVAPVLFLFILATFEFGRAFMAMELITEAARVGCRGYTDFNGTYWPGAIVATTQPQAITNAQTAATNYLKYLGITGEVVTEFASTPDANELTVKVSVPVSQISWVPNPLFTSGGNLVGKFTLTTETGL
jgi:Flp pilus assembly protein TadG